MFIQAIVAALAAAVLPLSGPTTDISPTDPTIPALPATLTFVAKLDDMNTARTVGAAVYRESRLGAILLQKLTVTMDNQRGGATIDVMIDSRRVGAIKTDATGYGKLEITAGAASPFPAPFPRIRTSSVVNVGTAQGKFRVQ